MTCTPRSPRAHTHTHTHTCLNLLERRGYGGARLHNPELASSSSQTPVSNLFFHDSHLHSYHLRDKKRAHRDSRSRERNDAGKSSNTSRVRVRSSTEDTLLEGKTYRRCHDRNDGARSSKRERTIDKDSVKSSGSPHFGASSARAATFIRSDEKSLIANCNIIDGKQFIEGDCKRLKRERAYQGNSCNFSEISSKFFDSETAFHGSKGEFNDDERVKNLAKKYTCPSKDKINLFRGGFLSVKEKHNDGDNGFAIVNNNAICSRMEDEGGLNRGEEHDCRGNETFGLSHGSEFSYCKAFREGSVISHLPKHSKVDHESENYILQSPEHSILEEDHIDDYHKTASEVLSQEDIKGRKSSASSPSVTNMLQACRSIHEYQRVSKISEGVYGVVFKAQDKKTREVVAIKKVKMEREKDGFPITSLREMNILLLMDHPSIVVVKEIAVDKDLESVYMVMEYMKQDLAGLLATHKSSFSQSEVKYMMLQLLEGVEYIHSNWVLHRDLKPSNVLVDSEGMLKICDFGLARQYGSPLKTYTHNVVSLWYRDPVLLLGSCKYSTAVDMWSLGCIMAELLGKVPLFEGCSELDQLKKIVAVLGSPDETVLQDKLSGVQFNVLRGPSKSMLRERFPPTSFTGKTPLSESGFNLLSRLLMYDPNNRISAEDAVRHDWFREDPLPKALSVSSYQAHKK